LRGKLFAEDWGGAGRGLGEKLMGVFEGGVQWCCLSAKTLKKKPDKDWEWETDSVTVAAHPLRKGRL